MQEIHFMTEYSFLKKKKYAMGEMLKEWKNSIIKPKCGKQKWKTTEELADLMHAINYIVTF